MTRNLEVFNARYEFAALGQHTDIKLGEQFVNFPGDEQVIWVRIASVGQFGFTDAHFDPFE